MNREEYEAYRWATATPRMIHIADLGLRDRTLAYGYDLDRNSVHVYVYGDEIHLLRYDHSDNIISHEHDHVLEARSLVPSKRAYPDATDFTFALLMLERDAPLCFTNFPEPESTSRANRGKFVGKIHTQLYSRKGA